MGRLDNGTFDHVMELSPKYLQLELARSMGLGTTSRELNGAFDKLEYSSRMKGAMFLRWFIKSLRLERPNRMLAELELLHGTIEVREYLDSTGQWRSSPAALAERSILLTNRILLTGTITDSHQITFLNESGEANLSVSLSRPTGSGSARPDQPLVLGLIVAALYQESADDTEFLQKISDFYGAIAREIWSSLTPVFTGLDLRSHIETAAIGIRTPVVRAIQVSADGSSLYLLSHYAPRYVRDPATHDAIPSNSGPNFDLRSQRSANFPSFAMVVRREFLVQTLLLPLLASRFPGLASASSNARHLAMSGASPLAISGGSTPRGVPMSASVRRVDGLLAWEDGNRSDFMLLYFGVTGTVGTLGTTFSAVIPVRLEMTGGSGRGGIRFSPTPFQPDITDRRQMVPAGLVALSILGLGLPLLVDDQPDEAVRSTIMAALNSPALQFNVVTEIGLPSLVPTAFLPDSPMETFPNIPALDVNGSQFVLTTNKITLEDMIARGNIAGDPPLVG